MECHVEPDHWHETVVVDHRIELHVLLHDVKLREQRKLGVELSSYDLDVVVEAWITEHLELLLQVVFLDAHLESDVLLLLLLLQLVEEFLLVLDVLELLFLALPLAFDDFIADAGLPILVVWVYFAIPREFGVLLLSQKIEKCVFFVHFI